MSSPSRRLALNSGTLLGLGALNAVLLLYRWFPAGRPVLLLVPAVETALLLLVLTRLSRRGGERLYRGVSFVSGVLLLPIIAFGLGETFFRYVYQAGFNPSTDLVFLPSFLNMIAGRELFQGPYFLLAVALVAGMTLGLLFGWVLGRWGQRVASFRWHRPVLWAVLGVSLIAATTDPPLTIHLARQLADTTEATPTGRTVKLPGETAQQAGTMDGAERDDKPRGLFPALADRDVRLFIIESYGHTLFSNEEHWVLIEPVYERLEQILAEEGFFVVSHFLESPAFGGRSWLADSTLLSGLWIDDQQLYNTMHDSGAVTLVRLMEQAGYHTLIAAPGMTYIEEEWFSFFPYETILIQDDFDYRGRNFSFGGGMTDQYLINYVRLLLDSQPEDRPLFATYVLVSSHVPFNVLPPFLPEWEKIGDGRIYYDYPRRIFENRWLTGGEYPEGYTASIEYVLETIVDYLENFVRDDTVVVVLGDHQPRIPIAEQESSYSVPIHIITRDDAYLDSYRVRGFSRGLRSFQPLPHPRMDQFYEMFVDAALGRRRSPGSAEATADSQKSQSDS